MSQFENATHPVPPNLSEGCYECGDGLDEILRSLTGRGALCKKCFNSPPPQKGKK